MFDLHRFMPVFFTNLTPDSPYWTYPVDIANQDDVASDIELIDDDGVKDNGCVIAGTVNPFSTLKRQGYIVQLDASGSLVWQKQYGGNENNDVYAIE